MSNVALSVLDPSPVVAGGTVSDALHSTLELAQKAEEFGFKRYWLAEHHNWPGMASSASAMIIGRVASVTNTIRVGSAATLLSHYSALSVAEQFGVLASYFPDRIDLGLGRAPGTDRMTSHLLNPHGGNAPEYPEKVKELYSYLHQSGTSTPDGKLSFHAIPGEGTKVPLWLHGSGTYSARLAGQLGLPFAFAGHFAPANMLQALQVYRNSFQPSSVLDKPHSLVAVSVIAADSTTEASRLATTLYLKYLLVDRGTPEPLQPPVDPTKLWDGWSDQQRVSAEAQLSETIIGDVPTVRQGIEDLLSRTGADEILVQSEIFDHRARIKSYELVARALELH